MPDVSKAQQHLMRAVEHGWKKPGGGGPSVAVAKEFVAADKARGPVKLPERVHYPKGHMNQDGRRKHTRGG